MIFDQQGHGDILCINAYQLLPSRSNFTSRFSVLFRVDISPCLKELDHQFYVCIWLNNLSCISSMSTRQFEMFNHSMHKAMLDGCGMGQSNY